MQTVTVPMESLAELISLQLESGGRASLTVTGISMMPMLRHRRDSVMLVPVTGPQKKGKIIFYRRANGQYVLHRIIGLCGDGYLCCGDNQAQKELVEHQQLIAVVDGFTRSGRTYALSHLGYRLYTAVWVNLFFLRRYYIAVRRRFGRLCRQLHKKTH